MLAGALALWLGALLAAEPAPPADILKKAFTDGPWRVAGAVDVYTGDGIYDYMDGAGELPRACGYRALAVAHLNGPKDAQATAELFATAADADAYGIYSLRRQPGEAIVPLTHRARWVDGELAGWRGPYAFVASGDRDKLTRDDLTAIAKRVEAAINPPGALPELLRRLPTEGLVADSARYFHGKFALDTVWFREANVLGVSEQTNCAAARYDKPAGTVLVVQYPDAKSCVAALAGWQALGDKGKGESAVASGTLLGLVTEVTDEAGGKVLAERLGARLAETGAAWSEG
jgi:hypothetical protein